MSGQETIFAIAAVAAILLLLLIWLFTQRRRTQELRDSFGDEYDRTVEAQGGRSKGEADLIERKERVSRFDIRVLTAEERDRYTADWKETKALFVDSPVEAVSRADRLLTDVMDTRGYPMADFEKRHADLTVNHGKVAKHYLEGHAVAERSSDATTEELRRAINHYEALIKEMTDGAAASDAEEGVIADDDEPVRSPAFSTTTSRPG